MAQILSSPGEGARSKREAALYGFLGRFWPVAALVLLAIPFAFNTYEYLEITKHKKDKAESITDKISLAEFYYEHNEKNGFLNQAEFVDQCTWHQMV